MPKASKCIDNLKAAAGRPGNKKAAIIGTKIKRAINDRCGTLALVRRSCSIMRLGHGMPVFTAILGFFSLAVNGRLREWLPLWRFRPIIPIKTLLHAFRHSRPFDGLGRESPANRIMYQPYSCRKVILNAE